MQGMRDLFNRSNLPVVRIKKSNITQQSAFYATSQLIFR